MSKYMASIMTVVKFYYSLSNKKPGTRVSLVSVFLHLRVNFSLGIERNLHTDADGLSHKARLNRQVVDLPINKWRANKRSGFVSHFLSWGFVQGGYSLYVY